jgi:hypothetical protein
MYAFAFGFSLAPHAAGLMMVTKSHHVQLFPYPAIPFIIFSDYSY